MSTRGLIGVYKDGKTKATYNSSDSYPSYLGVNILREARRIYVNRTKWIFEQIIMVNPDQKLDKKWIDQYKEPCNLSASTMNEISGINWYRLLSRIQGSLLPYLNGHINHMVDDTDFINESLFCEWAYIINLNDETLEVWYGFQEKPQKGNRYGESVTDNGYYPCALIKAYPLKKLPNPKRFIRELTELTKNED